MSARSKSFDSRETAGSFPMNPSNARRTRWRISVGMRDDPLGGATASLVPGAAVGSASATRNEAEDSPSAPDAGADDGEVGGPGTPGIDRVAAVVVVGGALAGIDALPQCGKEKSSWRTEESPCAEMLAVPASSACASSNDTTTVSCRLSPSRSAMRVVDDPSKTT